MNDVLVDYEPQSQQKPKLFWVVFILYAICVVVVYITDIMQIQQSGIQAVLSGPTFTLLLYTLDFFELFLLFGFYKRFKVAWCIIVILQGAFGTIFLKAFYFEIFVYRSPVWDALDNNLISLYFCLNSIVLVILLLQKRLTRYFNISNYLKIFAVLAVLTLMVLIVIKGI